MPAVNFDFNLAPKQALQYLNNKGFNLTFDYDEMQKSAHHASFTVAKVTRVDLLNDIFTSLNEAMASGETFNDWKKRIKPTLQKKGWWGQKEITDPNTGEVKEIYIGSRRLRTIFDTNMRVSYNVQRNHTMRQLEHEEYWRYSSMFLPNSRDEHERLDGTILHRDDPFWLTNYPPNGWYCKCKVRAYSKAQIDKKGMKIASKAPESIADDDWAYDIGAGSRVAKLAPLQLGDNLTRLAPNPALEQLDNEQVKQRFYQTLNTASGEQYIDKVGDPMFIDDELFKKALNKDNRHYIDELAKTISNPDEIYIEIESQQGKQQIIKKMLRYFTGDNDAQLATVAQVVYNSDKTIATNLSVLDKDSVIDSNNPHKLIYQKP